MTTINQTITIQYASNVVRIAPPGDCGPNSPCNTHDIVPVNSGDPCQHQDTTTAGHSIIPPAEDQPPNNDAIKSKSKSVTFDTSPGGSSGYEAGPSSSSSSNSSNSFNSNAAEASHSNPDDVSPRRKQQQLERELERQWAEREPPTLTILRQRRENGLRLRGLDPLALRPLPFGHPYVTRYDNDDSAYEYDRPTPTPPVLLNRQERWRYQYPYYHRAHEPLQFASYSPYNENAVITAHPTWFPPVYPPRNPPPRPAPYPPRPPPKPVPKPVPPPPPPPIPAPRRPRSGPKLAYAVPVPPGPAYRYTYLNSDRESSPERPKPPPNSSSSESCSAGFSRPVYRFEQATGHEYPRFAPDVYGYEYGREYDHCYDAELVDAGEGKGKDASTTKPHSQAAQNNKCTKRGLERSPKAQGGKGKGMAVWSARKDGGGMQEEGSGEREKDVGKEVGGDGEANLEEEQEKGE